MPIVPPGISSRLRRLTTSQPVIRSTPMAVDVSADGMRKKSKALKGTTVSYSGIKTSSQGLLTGVKTEKKTLLGG
jgi:hypothetical protein